MTVPKKDDLILYFDKLFGHAPIPAAIINTSGSIYAANNAFHQIINIQNTNTITNLSGFEHINEKLLEQNLSNGQYHCNVSIDKTCYNVIFSQLSNTINNILLLTLNFSTEQDKSNSTTTFVDAIESTLENVPDYVYIKNHKGQLVFANKALKSLARNCDIQDIYKAYNSFGNGIEFFDKLFRYDTSILLGERKRKKYAAKIKAIQEIGEYHLNLHKFNLGNVESSLKGVMCIGQNLNAFVKAINEVNQGQANLTAILESTHNYIWLVDREFRYIYFNSYHEQYIKQTLGVEIKPGSNSLDGLNQNDHNHWFVWYTKVLKNERIVEEYETSGVQGKKIFEASLNPIYGHGQQVTGISVFLKDITGRKTIEVELQKIQLRFRQLSESINDAIILWDNKQILYVNSAFFEIFDDTVENLGLNNGVLTPLINKSDAKRFTKNLALEMEGKKSPDNQQYNIVTPKDVSKLIWVRTYPVTIETQSEKTYITVISDFTGQKKLEDSLSTSLHQQRAIIDNIPYYAWLKDSNGKYLMVNESFAGHYKKQPADIIGNTDYDFCKLTLAEKYRKHDETVIKNRQRNFLEEFEETKKGNRWIETYKAPIFDEDGNVIGITGISRDITDRKSMEEAIIKNEEHFRSLLQYSSDSITILNEKGVITFESSLKNRISDFNIDELLGKHYTEIIHPDDLFIIRDVLAEALQNPGIQIKKEYRSLHKNRRWIYVESIFMNHLQNPSIKGIVVNTRDVSDRKMSELKERVYHDNLIFLSNSALDLLTLAQKADIFEYISKRLYGFLKNSIVIASSYNDKKRRFITESGSGIAEINKQIETFFGLYPKNIEIPLSYLHDLSDTPGVITAFTHDLEKYPVFLNNRKVNVSQLFNDLMVHKTYNIIIARDNKLLGNITILTLSKSIIKFKHIIETFVHQVAVALHRNVLETELLLAKTKAEESDRLKTAFLANMSHEIRTPMNGILGFTEMLSNDKLSPEERKKYIGIINSNGKVLIRLIDDIIDFSKIEAEQLNILKHDFNLNMLLSQVHASFLNMKLLKEKENVKLVLNKGLDDNDSYINTDPNRLRQVITNLVGNALKFTNEGFVEFGYSLITGNKIIQFYVKDSGIGISNDKLVHIFDRFVQADNSRSRKYSGSGLGLAISKGITNLLGGKIWAESEMGKGSVFYFTIPFIPAEKITNEQEQEQEPKKSYNWKGKTFLVAEDDFFSFKFLEGSLNQENVNVLHAKNGLEAVEICKKDDSIEIVLMDVQMPEMNGLDATSNIKKFKKGLPIIAQTANAIAEEKERCFEAGFDDFVTKPINIANLFVVIDKWLHKKQIDL